MLVIAIPESDLATLHTGVHVRINGEAEVIKREGDYLCYAECRCKILEERPILDGAGVPCISFACASHGQENESHTIIG